MIQTQGCSSREIIIAFSKYWCNLMYIYYEHQDCREYSPEKKNVPITINNPKRKSNKQALSQIELAIGQSQYGSCSMAPKLLNLKPIHV